MIHDMMTRDIKNNIHRAVAHSWLRSLLVLALLLLGVSGVKAQNETVTIGSGTNSAYYNGSPFGDYYNYSTTASLYTSTEIGQSGTITAIAYNCASRNAFTDEVHIYMATVNKTAFSGDNDWPTTYTEVYSNSTLTMASSTGWNTITLTTPYNYDKDAGSLVVIVTRSGNWKSQSWYYTSASNTHLYRSNDNTANYASITNTSNGSRSGNRPNIRLTFQKQFFFSASAIASPAAGGSANVSPATTDVSAPMSNTSATTTATFTATPNTGYRFLGWSTSADGSIESSDNPYAKTITSTSTNSASPTNTTLYARFNQLTAVNPTSITAEDISVDKDNTVTASNYTLTATGLSADQYAYNYVTATSSNTSIATVTNSNGTFSITGVAAGTATITITAYNTDNTTPACTTTFTVTVEDIQSGIVGSTVTLDDREDHNWSYYSDPDCPIRSLNPADVKITYLGNGKKYTSTTATPSGELSAATGVKVGPDADANTFVYYKTLERTDGATATTVAGATGRCAYTTIPNPFSIRPTFTSGGNTYYTGFYTWRVKSLSGGSIYTASSGGTSIAVGGTIDAETEVFFAPTSSTGMAVELEAVWARAYVVTSNTTSGLNSDVSYERNFVYLSSNTTIRNGALNVPATYTTVDPATGSGTKRTITIRDNFTCGANTKFENVTFAQYNNNNQTLTANNNDLIIGRGCTGTVNLVRGMSGDATSAVSYTIRLESGTYNQFALIDNTAHTYSSTISTKAVFGCDYDRVQGDNTKLSISPNNTIYGGNAVHTFSSQSNRNNITYDWIIKSGKVQGSKTISDASADEAIYIGNSISSRDANSIQYCGKRRLTMEGGEIASIAGSVNCYGNNYANYGVNDGSWSVMIRLKGGTVRGSIYGAAAYAGASGDRLFVMTGGTINGWVAGGANGTQSDGGMMYGASSLYVGGNTRISSGNNNVINRALGGNVFGAGCGYGSGSSSGQVTEGTTVVVADNAYVERGVYGGGSYGYTTNTSNLYILGGTVAGKNGGVSGTSYSADITGGVFGGACQNQGGTVNIYMNGGEVHGGVYGGSNLTGTISGDVTMKINGGQVGTSSQAANIHGGGFGSSTVVNGWVEVTLGQEGQTEGGVLVYGDVYGGSALGEINGTDPTTTFTTRVTLNKGVINGSLYGGGLGDNTYAANVNGPVTVTVNGGSVKTTSADGSGAVYGCNNISGAPQRSVTVIINGTDPAPDENTYALDAVYGGGNKANYSYGTPTVTVNNCDNSIAYVYGGGNAAHITNGGTDVTIYGGNKIGTVFGGGNGTVTPANVSGDTNVKIYGGTIGQVFGGSNSQGTIGGTINVTIQKQGSCAMHIDEVYGGGNMAASNAGNLTIGCTGNEGEGIGDVYGGANAADITGNIALNITGGSINRVFGGNNASGSISGTIQVDVNWNSTCGYNYLGSVFGGGNQAAYGNAGENKGNYPVVNLFNGTVSENVFGGGLGSTAIVYGNPQVTIGDATASHKAIVKGDVYGGGDAAAVSGTPVVKVVNKCNTEIGNVYGGGNAADVTATNVTINGGTINGDVYGGGHGDKSADVSANVNGNVSLSVTGGTINRVFGGSNSQGSISGTISVNIDKGNESCDMKIGEVYGGGNEAAGNAGSITIGCTGTPDLTTIDATHRLGYELEGIGDVYGGANAADIGTSGAHSDITLNIQGGAINRVFGGNNTSGTIYGDIEVNINWSGSCTNYIYDVFGCGNVANYSGSSTVNLINGDISHCVYGGGNEADAGTAATYIKGGTVASGVYGGCNTSGTATGDITVGVTGGTIGTSTAKANVHGGGYGSATASEGNVTVSIGTTSGGVNSGTGVIYGDVYGGSALGNVNSDTSDNTNVNLLSGTVHGDVYGGGLGDSENAALVKGNVVVKLNEGVTTTKGCIVDGRIFGCNNANGTPQGLVTVYVYATQKADKANVTKKADKGSGTFDVQAVYGGGNQAAYQPTNLETGKSKVVINGCALTSIGYVYGGGNAASSPATEVEVNSAYEIDYVFGGGNGKDALPNGDENPGAHVGYLTWEEGSASNVAYGTGIATTNLYGGTINHVFGGSNTKGNVREVAVAMLNEGNDCQLNIEEIYGGGNEAYMEGKGSINLGCVTYMKEVYGGAKNAPVGNDVELTITSGHFDRVFGGNNIGGAINGSITVNIEETGCNPITIGELYGCGNAAPYTTPAGKSQPTINIKSCTSIGRVFGGGFGSTADVTGSPVVNINEVVGENSTETSTYAGTTRTLKDGTTVTLPPHTSGAIGAIGTIYGGGNAAQVTGNTTVHIGTQPTISYVSGNDHSAKTVVGANITGNVFGGGLGSSAVVTGNTDVVIGK